MALIEWKSDLSVGIPSIDAQHKNLVQMLNDLHTASNEGRGSDMVGETLAGLVRYTAEHFAYEEKLFATTGYPDAEKHKKEHDELTQTVMNICTKFEAGPTASLSQETLQFLVKWLINHTMSSDKEYSAHLIAAGVT